MKVVHQPAQPQRRACQLSMAPRLVPKLLDLIQDPNSNTEEFIELIRMDPALSAAVLQACRSATVQRGDEVRSVDDAIRCLGFFAVFRLVILTAFKRGYSDRFFAYEDTPDLLWRRTIRTAYFMEEFADEAGLDRAVYYSCGLLHAIGRFYIDWNSEDRGLPQIPTGDRALMLDIERLRVGYTHTELTAMIMEYWNFPESIVEAIRLCDAGEADGERPPAAQHLALAIRLAHATAAELDTLRTLSDDGDPSALTPSGLPLRATIDRVEQLLRSAERFATV